MSKSAEEEYRDRHPDKARRNELDPVEHERQRLLWFCVLVGPLGAIVNQQVTYMLVEWVCKGGSAIWLHVVPVLILATIAYGAAKSEGLRRIYRSSELDRSEVIEHRSVERSRFMAKIALWLSALSFLLVLLMWIANFIVDPCKT